MASADKNGPGWWTRLLAWISKGSESAPCAQ